MNIEQSHVYDKAQLAYQQEHFDAALEMFEAVRAACDDYSIENYIGCCLLGLGKYSEAVELFKNILSACPDWERPWFNLGRAYLRTEQNRKGAVSKVSP